MNWEHLTAPDFAQAVRDTGGVCVLPIGVLEKHADHLPLGTDALLSHRFWMLSGGAQATQLLQFMKNIGLIGGLLLLSAVAGGGKRR